MSLIQNTECCRAKIDAKGRLLVIETADRVERLLAWSNGRAVSSWVRTRRLWNWSNVPWWTACLSSRPSCTSDTGTSIQVACRSASPEPYGRRACSRTVVWVSTPLERHSCRSTWLRPRITRTRKRRLRAPSPPPGTFSLSVRTRQSSIANVPL